jgi:amidohydrolase
MINKIRVMIILICSLVLIGGTGNLFSENGDIYRELKKLTEQYYPEAVSIRRHLHTCPEPCFKENETSKFVADYLRKCGLDVKTGIAGTGIKAVLHGGSKGPVVGIRSDLDALPITEETGLEFQSKNKGYMHACGHDAHMTNVLIAARILSDVKEKIKGTIVFVFQPCEEGAPGGQASGADVMIEEGILENPKIDAMVGLHVMPGYPTGSVALRSGPIMANVASVFITIHGKSSHGAFPHQGVDAIYAASTAVQQFQSLISRRKDPNEKAVLTIGKFNGGVRLNVIAEKVEMEGTVRTFSFDTQDMIEKGIKNILEGLKISMGISYDFRFEKTSQYVKNDNTLTKKIQPLFKKLLGAENVHITEPVTIGEDFSAYSHKIPSFFFFLGAGLKGKLHSSTFSVPEESLRYGPLLLASAALEAIK